MLRLIGIKTFLDGGMLTGSAYMLEPWGVSKTYSITDPKYRGVLLIPPQRLLPIARAAAESGLQFTAHSVGDGAVRTLLDTYEQRSHGAPARRLCAPPAPASPTAISLTPPTSSGFSPARCDRRRATGLALPRRADPFRPVRLRPPVPFPAAARFVRRRRDAGRRIGPHAEDRRTPGDQRLRPVPRHGHHDHPDRPLVRPPAAPRRSGSRGKKRSGSTRSTTPSCCSRNRRSAPWSRASSPTLS